jgi:hypothetical protein
MLRVEPVIENKPWPAPPTIVHVTTSLAVSAWESGEPAVTVGLDVEVMVGAVSSTTGAVYDPLNAVTTMPKSADDPPLTNFDPAVMLVPITFASKIMASLTFVPV